MKLFCVIYSYYYYHYFKWEHFKYECAAVCVNRVMSVFHQESLTLSNHGYQDMRGNRDLNYLHPILPLPDVMTRRGLNHPSRVRRRSELNVTSAGVSPIKCSVGAIGALSSVGVWIPQRNPYMTACDGWLCLIWRDLCMFNWSTLSQLEQKEPEHTGLCLQIPFPQFVLKKKKRHPDPLYDKCNKLIPCLFCTDCE